MKGWFSRRPKPLHCWAFQGARRLTGQSEKSRCHAVAADGASRPYMTGVSLSHGLSNTPLPKKSTGADSTLPMILKTTTRGHDHGLQKRIEGLPQRERRGLHETRQGESYIRNDVWHMLSNSGVLLAEVFPHGTCTHGQALMAWSRQLRTGLPPPRFQHQSR
jgi:hypothetical protein